MLKGAGNDGQSSLFSDFLRKYTEETSASVTPPESQNKMADFNSLSATGPQFLDRGGEGGVLELSTVQDNSIIASEPASTDYLNGFRRNQIVQYEVQTGDLLSFIASDFGVSVNSIIWANGLNNADSIKPGQTLRIPPVSGVIHKVAKGDTLVSIAKKYGVDSSKITAFNGISKDTELVPEEEIIVPDGQIKRPYSPNYGVSGNNLAKRFSYLPDLGDFFLIPTTGFDWGRIHDRNGVDIANSCGTAVYAAADGSAAIADGFGWNGGFGKFIKIVHSNGTETLYAHLSKLVISTGETVTKGQLIALMGTTGNSSGCHLHFEVHGAKNPLAKY